MDADSPNRSRSGFVRLAEYRRLRSSLDRLGQRRSTVVELVGQPGMGKTRLLEELTAEARRRGVTAITGCCSEAELNSPFQALTAFRGNERTTLGRLAAHDLRSLSEVTAPIAGQPTGRNQSVGWSGPYRSAVRRVLTHCARGGLLLVLDDFHWADRYSIEVLDHLIRWPVEAPLVVVIAYRPRQASTQLCGTLARGIEVATVQRVELEPLGLGQAADLLGLPESDARLRRLHRDSEGNPLYLSALSFQRVGLDPAEDRSSARLGDVPEHLAALILGETALLSPIESAVLSAAAVLGWTFDTHALTAVAGVKHQEALSAVARLTSRELIKSMGQQPGLTLRHAVVRDVLYSHLEPAQRAAAHLRAVAHLSKIGMPAAALVEHVERSLVFCAREEFTILIDVARDAVNSSPEIAARWLRCILRALPDDEAESRRVDLTLLLAKALGYAGKTSDSKQLMHELLRTIPEAETETRAAVIAFYLQLELLLGNDIDARTVIADELGRLQSKMLVAKAATNLGVLLLNATCQRSPDRPDAGGAVRRAVRLGDRDTDESGPPYLWRGLLASGTTRRVRTLDQLHDVAVAEEVEYLAMKGWAQTIDGQFADASSHFKRGVMLARRTGRRYALPILLAGASNAGFHVGHLAEARQLARQAGDAARLVEAQRLHGFAIAMEAFSTAWIEHRGRGSAAELAQQAVETLPPGDGSWSIAPTFALASAVWLDGDPEQCVGLLTSVFGDDLAGLPLDAAPMVLELLVAAAADAGQIREYWADRAQAVAEALNLPFQRAFATAARAHVLRAKADHVLAVGGYRAAAAQFSLSGMAIHRSRMLILAAECGAHDRAALLEVARSLAHRRGAHRLCQDARKLEKSPPPAAGRGPGGDSAAGRLAVLTDREREVAQLACTGKRTRDIAEELVLSPRTVDVHLTHIYRKLGVRSRAALVRLLADIDSRAAATGERC